MLNATANNLHLYQIGGPENELVPIPAFGEHPKCGKCPQALACGSGALPKILMVGRTREDHLNGITVRCIENGKVKLVPPRYEPLPEPAIHPAVVTYPTNSAGITNITDITWEMPQYYVVSNNSK